jgi:stage V sporulation protein G
MEITEVKVFPIQEEKLKAFVSIVFDQCFMVNDIKIIQGRDGLFISMPSRKKKNGEFKDVAHPLNNETRRMIEDKVLGEYERVLAERGEQLPAPPHHLADGAASVAAQAAAPAAQAAAGAVGGHAAAPAAHAAATAPAAPAEVRAMPAPAAMVAAELSAAGAPAVAGSDGASGSAAPSGAAGSDGAAGASGSDGAGAAGAGAASSQAPPSPSVPPEKTMEEIEEMHLRDSFWTT